MHSLVTKSFLYSMKKNDNSFFHHFSVKRDLNAQRVVTSLMDCRGRSIVSEKMEISRILPRFKLSKLRAIQNYCHAIFKHFEIPFSSSPIVPIFSTMDTKSLKPPPSFDLDVIYRRSLNCKID